MLKRSSPGNDNSGVDPTEGGTDFSTWTEKEIKDFLDRRGEDYDDCKGFEDLVIRAKECEHNTGLATKVGDDVVGEPGGEEEDPLDAFMKDIEAADQTVSEKLKHKGDIIDIEDPGADFMASKEQDGQRQEGNVPGEQNVADNQEGDEQNMGIQILDPLAHQQIEYEPFNKDFYDEVAFLSNLDAAAVAAKRREHKIRAYGGDVPCPVNSFAQCGFDRTLLATIEKSGFKAPTAIQSQVMPVVLSGRDVLVGLLSLEFCFARFCIRSGFISSIKLAGHRTNWKWKDCGFYIADDGSFT